MNTKPIKFIQINLNNCKAAQALLQQTVAEKSVDFALVSEMNRTEGPNWYADTNGKAAIVNLRNARLDNEGQSEPGFRWVTLYGMRIYSCYWSPNTTLQEFKDFTSRLETSIRSESTEVLLVGDFNAKHVDWGCPQNDRRGEVLSDLINAIGLVVCNIGNSITFNRGSIIDLTIATPRTAMRVSKWKVLDEISLSDHYYLTYEINCRPLDRETSRTPKIDIQKLKNALTSNRLQPLLTYTDAEQKALALTETIQTCRRTNQTESSGRRSVHWWSPEISALRRTANHLRRVFQRKRKRKGPAASTAEENDAKTAKRELVRAIKKAKEDSWKSLCDLVQQDPWGLPYKLIMGKLIKPQPIPELNAPGRLHKIVRGLFPQQPIRSASVPFLITEGTGPIDPIAHIELINAARCLKNNKAPGPDGISNEALKTIVALKPDALIDVYNTCLLGGVFPRVWKSARLVLIRKGNKPLDDPTSYRPLCLLDCLGKLFEKILDNRLRQYLDDNDGLHDRQFGFRKGRSTTDALEALKTTVKSSNLKVGVLTLDIKNAFNSAPWKAILEAMNDKEVPGYLQRIICSYLENRSLLFESGGVEKNMMITCGVPQGSVLGPTLWNVLYDGLLRTHLPTGVEYLAFADDVAIVAKARDSIRLEQLLASAVQVVQDWLAQTGLSLSAQKCEVMIITNTRTHNELNLVIDSHQVTSSSCIKYLGIHIDNKWRFSEHAKTVAAKAGKAVQCLSRILPNISAAKPTKRKLLSNVAHAIMLYGSPFWSQDMSTSGWMELNKVQRRMALRVISAYCTVSGDAAMVIAGILPIDLMAKDRRRRYQVRKNLSLPHPEDEGEVTAEWQSRWDNSVKGRWTHRLIPNIERWIQRKHGEVNFHLTQVLTGHGCFAQYLNRFGKIDNAECWYCGHQVDDAFHMVFVCDAWFSRRSTVEKLIGHKLEPENMVETMLKSKGNWEAINNFIHTIFTKKEEEERRRQAASNE